MKNCKKKQIIYFPTLAYDEMFWKNCEMTGLFVGSVCNQISSYMLYSASNV